MTIGAHDTAEALAGVPPWPALASLDKSRLASESPALAVVRCGLRLTWLHRSGATGCHSELCSHLDPEDVRRPPPRHRRGERRQVLAPLERAAEVPKTANYIYR